MLKINISLWKVTLGKMFFGKAMNELIAGYISASNLRYLSLWGVRFKRKPVGTKRAIGTFFPNNSIILSNQTSLANFPL
jgi:hypothetical protein